MTTETIMFKDICKSYHDLINNDAGSLLKGHVTCYTHKNPEPELTLLDEWCPYIFALLYGKYRNYQIKYDDAGSFLYDLWLDIIYYTPNYWARRSLYERLMRMSDDELCVQYQNISTFTDHTDSEVEKPLDDIIKSLTNQSGNKNTIGKATAIRNYLYHFQYTLDKDYLDKFRHLFLNLYSTADCYI